MKARTKKTIEDFMHSGLDGHSSPELKRRIRLINTFSIVGVTSLLVFGFANLVQGQVFIGVLELFFAGASILNVIYLRKRHNARVSGRFILLFMIIILTVLFIKGGVGGVGTFWFFTFPLLAFHMSETREGTLWTISLFALILIIHIFLPLLGVMVFERTTFQVVVFILALFAVSLMVYFYELAGNEFRDVINRQTRDIASAAEVQKTSTETIDVQEEKLAGQVEDLENARKAMLNILEDLNEEKEKMAQGRALDEAILSSVGNGLVVTNEAGNVILTNEAALTLLEMKTEEVIGKNWSDVICVSREDKTYLKKEELPFSIALKEKKTVLSVFPDLLFYESKKGKRFPVSITAAPVIKNEKLLGSVIIFREISREIEIDKAKTEFVSLASHQLRTPLSAINWYAEMLMAGDVGKLSPEQEKYLGEIYKGNQRMVELVNALLNVSRMELGTFMVDPEEVEPIKILRSVLDELKPQSDEKDISMEVQVDNVPKIQADPKLVRILFQNLLSNAVKYTPEKGTVSTWIGTKKRGEEFGGRHVDKDCVVWYVRDSGYGIPDDQKDKIFSKLFRADNVREKSTEGTGLGLYLVKQILENSEGDVWFHSEEDKGTTFYVILPLEGMSKKRGDRKLT